MMMMMMMMMIIIIIIIIIIKWSGSGPSRFSPDKIVLYQLRRSICEVQFSVWKI